jgi:HSP20 family molecular chaperone IbpA
MSEIIVRKVHDLDDRSLPVFAEIDRVMESIGRRARELIVHGHLRREHKEKTGDVRWSEFRSSDVYRRIELPAPIDAGHVKATLKQGMLTVVAAKAALEVPKKSPVSIPIAA